MCPRLTCAGLYYMIFNGGTLTLHNEGCLKAFLIVYSIELSNDSVAFSFAADTLRLGVFAIFDSSASINIDEFIGRKPCRRISTLPAFCINIWSIKKFIKTSRTRMTWLSISHIYVYTSCSILWSPLSERWFHFGTYNIFSAARVQCT